MMSSCRAPSRIRQVGSSMEYVAVPVVGPEWVTVLFNTLVCGCCNKRAWHNVAIVKVTKGDAAADHGWVDCGVVTQ